MIVGLAVTGCGGSGHATTTVTATSSAGAQSAGAVQAAATVPATPGSANGRTRGTGTLTMAGVGTLTYSCHGTPPQLAGTLAGRIAATETVHVQDGGLTHLLSGRLEPPARLAVRVRGAAMLWHVVQNTEGSTTDVVLRLTFAPGCAEMHWSSLVLVIDHGVGWRPPAPWL